MLRELENFIIISINKTCLFIWNLNRKCSQIIRSSHRRCSIKKLYLKISQYSQENTYARGFFNQVKGCQVCNFIKKIFQHRHFSVNIVKFLKTVILKKICEQLWLLICCKTKLEKKKKLCVFFTKYTFFGEKNIFISKKNFTLKNFFTEKNFFYREKKYIFFLQKKIFLIIKNIFVKTLWGT